MFHLQLTVYYVQSITNKFIECSMWYQKHVHVRVRRHKHSATSYVHFVTCPNPERYLKSTIDFSDTIQDGDQVC